MGLAQLVMVADNSQRNAPLEATPTGALFGDLEARERDATPRTPWSPPDEIDGYRLLRPIGRGGMGRVYLGFEGALARNVALKFLSPEILREPEAHERFRVEARAIARAQHPNVVTIYRVGEQRGLPYIAYEFVRGRTLDALESMSWQRLLTLAIGCARGLAAAHRRGVLHRDIKPSNIVVCDETGEPKLIDFGIAKLAELGADAEPRVEADAREQQEAPRRSLAHPSASGVYAATLSMRVTATTPTSFAPDPAPDSTRTLTRFGTLLGTPYYLAPERWRGEEATARADIYALGVVLYDLCAGAATTSGPGPKLRPALHSVCAEVPEALAAVIDRCVASKPARRPASAEALLRELCTVKIALMRLGLYSDVPELDEQDRGSSIDLVQRSFARIAPKADDFTRDFYDALFAREPALRALFPEDLTGQRRKLLEAMQIAIDGLRTPTRLDVALERLGARHAAYGVLPSHFDIVGAALLATIQESDPEYNGELARAWENAYDHIASVMRRGLERAREGRGVAETRVIRKRESS